MLHKGFHSDNVGLNKFIFNNVIGRPEVVSGLMIFSPPPQECQPPSVQLLLTLGRTLNPAPWMDMEKDGRIVTKEGAADLRGAISALRQSIGR